MDTQTLYREELLEHYRNPQNFGKISNFSVSSKQTNPFCGDELEIFVRCSESWGANRTTPLGCRINDIGFVGKGCAISMAGASMLTEHVKGKTKKELTKFSENDMLNLLGIEVSQTRKKCALLAHSVLKDCLWHSK